MEIRKNDINRNRRKFNKVQLTINWFYLQSWYRNCPKAISANHFAAKAEINHSELRGKECVQHQAREKLHVLFSKPDWFENNIYSDWLKPAVGAKKGVKRQLSQNPLLEISIQLVSMGYYMHSVDWESKQKSWNLNSLIWIKGKFTFYFVLFTGDYLRLRVEQGSFINFYK